MTEDSTLKKTSDALPDNGREDLKSPSKAGRRVRFLARLRRYFLAGILVTAPIGITLYVAWIFVAFIDRQVTPLIPAEYNPSTYLPFQVPGLGLILLAIALILIGWLTASFAGRLVVRSSERALERMPVIRNIYGAIKQLFETVLSRQSATFRDVVLFEYPRRGSWAIGFITGVTRGEVQNLTADETVNVFLPTTPNPTSGYLLFIPRKELIPLDMSVEDGIKMVISGGIVTPNDLRSVKEQEKPKIGPAARDSRTIPYKEVNYRKAKAKRAEAVDSGTISLNKAKAEKGD